MFNTLDNHGFVIGSEVVLYKGQSWLVVAEDDDLITIENDFSLDPNYREYSGATMMYVYVEEVMKNEVKPFASIVIKKGTDEEWNKVYRSVGLMI